MMNFFKLRMLKKILHIQRTSIVNNSLFWYFLLSLFISCLTNNSVATEDLKLINLGPAPVISGFNQDNLEINYNPVTSGEITLVNFFFTSCHGPCPIIMENVKRLLNNSKCKKLKAISISVDPDFDSPKILKDYKESRNFDDPRWSLLNSSKEHINNLLNKGFKLGSGANFAEHTVRIVLTDSKGDIRILKQGNGSPDAGEMSQLASAITELCPDK